MIGLFVKKGQSTAEYAILFAIVIAVISGMQLYFRRGLNAKIKYSTDRIPDIVMGSKQANVDPKLDFRNAAQQKQYEPYYSQYGDYNWETTMKDGTETTFHQSDAATGIGGGTVLDNRKSTRKGDQTTTRYGRIGSEGRFLPPPAVP